MELNEKNKEMVSYLSDKLKIVGQGDIIYIIETFHKIIDRHIEQKKDINVEDFAKFTFKKLKKKKKENNIGKKRVRGNFSAETVVSRTISEIFDMIEVEDYLIRLYSERIKIFHQIADQK
jgi:nucleoid DNA-binding protein